MTIESGESAMNRSNFFSLPLRSFRVSVGLSGSGVMFALYRSHNLDISFTSNFRVDWQEAMKSTDIMIATGIFFKRLQFEVVIIICDTQDHNINYFSNKISEVWNSFHNLINYYIYFVCNKCDDLARPKQ